MFLLLPLPLSSPGVCRKPCSPVCFWHSVHPKGYDCVLVKVSRETCCLLCQLGTELSSEDPSGAQQLQRSLPKKRGGEKREHLEANCVRMLVKAVSP